MLGTQVVHDDDVAATELGKQLFHKPCNEPVAVGSRELGRHRDPATAADGAEQREVLAPIHRATLDMLLALANPGMGSTHREVQARFVEEYESIDRHPANESSVSLALQRDVGT